MDVTAQSVGPRGSGPTGSRDYNGRRRRDNGQTRAKARRDTAFGLSLIAPQTIGFAVFAIYPLVEVFRLSLYRINSLSGLQKFVGLENYKQLFSDPNTGTILLNTGYFVVLLSISSTILSLSLAILVNQKLRGINVFRALIFVPALITMVAWTLVWRFILQPDGLLDSLTAIGGIAPQPWLRGHWLTLTVLVVMQLLKNVGLHMMLFLAGLQAVPQDLVDASKVDGAGAWRSFRSVVVPELSPTIIMVFMLTIVGSFKVFDEIYLLTEGGPGVNTTVLAFAVYNQAFERNNIGLSSAFAVLLFVFVLLLTVLVWRSRKRTVSYESD